MKIENELHKYRICRNTMLNYNCGAECSGCQYDMPKEAYQMFRKLETIFEEELR